MGIIWPSTTTPISKANISQTSNAQQVQPEFDGIMIPWSTLQNALMAVMLALIGYIIFTFIDCIKRISNVKSTHEEEDAMSVHIAGNIIDKDMREHVLEIERQCIPKKKD